MTFLTDMQTVANELLTEYGETVSGQRVTEGAYDPTTSTTAAGSTTNYSGVGLPTQYNEEHIDGQNILQGDVLLVMYSTTQPEVGDRLTFNSLAYRSKTSC
jgi:hypothetical protein